MKYHRKRPEEVTMKTRTIIFALAALFAVAAQAGAPKAEHPCYGVADCATKGSQQEFSACIKANKAEADANEACAAFRKDKDAWMKEHGYPDLGALFES
jgi:hypothetical protein